MTSAARELNAHEVLVVDADPATQKGMVQLLSPLQLHVTAVGTHEKAVELIKHKLFGVVIADLDTPGPSGGLELVKKVHELSPTTTVLVLSPRKSFEAAVQAFRAGAHDVVVKAPDQVDYLKERVLAAAAEGSRQKGHGELFGDVKDMLEDVLRRLLEAERRALDLEDRAAGRDISRTDIEEEMRALIVDADARLFKMLSEGKIPGFTFAYAQSGGEALDHATSHSLHIVLVGPNLPDLPPQMVVQALKTQAPEITVITYAVGGKLEIVEQSKTIPLVDKFTSPNQLTERLGELAQAHRAKGRERRYLQSFRERHYEFLRKMSEIRKRLDKDE